jgi:hypothetical protein
LFAGDKKTGGVIAWAIHPLFLAANKLSPHSTPYNEE